MITFFTINYLRERETLNCINSIRKFHTKDPIIVISIAKSKRFNNHWVNEVLYEKNIGVSAFRNLAIKYSTTQYICFIDNDCVLTGKIELPEHPIHGAMQVPYRNYNEESIRYGRVYSPFPISKKVYAPHQNLDIIDGTAFITSKKVLKKYPFDERYKVGWEDLDWSLLLRKNDIQLFSIVQPCVIHFHTRENESAYNKIRWDKRIIEDSRQLFIEKWKYDPQQ